ncbi:hypothetical protein HYDPIDRAFT_29539 [Hydnomerulius pinastri MD-312]|uniref:F-box domain-containing protein n=1 Tax=Hydnomerulius pinastri MD-312 TaxID=994086 RepID=A0A0C9VY83_9AGAM|nr:hypothetical protein HYDPIDRAFT_29539 [Hydnomerulius pinastri MD-312]
MVQADIAGAIDQVPTKGLVAPLLTEGSSERVLFEQDWETFHYYAHRVRSLVVAADQSSLIDKSFVLAVSGSPFPSLLPNLKELFWFDESEAFSQLMRFFLGPSLQTLYLHESQPTQFARQAVVASLGQFCPSLRRLTMISELSANNCRTICGLKHLTYLVVGYIDRRALEHLSSLQSLVELEVLVGETTLPNRSFQPVITFSRNLRSLRISAPAFPSACLLLDDTYFSLEELTIKLDQVGWTSLDDCLLTALRPFAVTLTKCNIHTPMAWSPRTTVLDTHFSFSLTGIAPLLSCHKLQELVFYGTCCSVIDNSDMERMAKSWPELTVLHLGVDHPWRDPPKLTLSGLCSLLEHCPLLSRLGVVFVAQVSGPFTSAPPKKRMVNERITCLDVGTSPIEEPLKVAAFLSAILPNLKLFEYFPLPVHGDVDPVHPVYRKRWKLAQENYELFVTARQQGMNIQAAREEDSVNASEDWWSDVLVD